MKRRGRKREERREKREERREKREERREKREERREKREEKKEKVHVNSIIKSDRDDNIFLCVIVHSPFDLVPLFHK